jgi:hypothetical protein
MIPGKSPHFAAEGPARPFDLRAQRLKAAAVESNIVEGLADDRLGDRARSRHGSTTTIDIVAIPVFTVSRQLVVYVRLIL